MSARTAVRRLRIHRKRRLDRAFKFNLAELSSIRPVPQHPKDIGAARDGVHATQLWASRNSLRDCPILPALDHLDTPWQTVRAESLAFSEGCERSTASELRGLGESLQLFISYARPDRPNVDPLAQRLRQAGNSVWLDTDLSGGQVWWDKILDQLRQCDALLAIVSRASLKSQACTIERQYAMRLGKPVLPLAIDSLDSAVLPSDIARLQIIDYSRPDEAAAFKLVGAIMRLPPPQPLPRPLPRPPDVPISYWDTIADQLSAPALNLDQQLAIVGRLEGAFAPSADPNDRPAAFELLRQMEARSDLFAAVDRRIAALRNSLKSATAPDPPIRASEPPTQQAPPANGMDGTSFRPVPHPATAQGWQQQATHAPSQDWQQAPPGPSQGWQQAPPRPLPGWQQQPPPPASAVSPHWVMAIVALLCCWPTGIPAVVYASRVKPSLGTNDVATALKSSSRVKVFFWISLGLFVLFWLIVIAAGSSSNSQNAAALINPILP